MRHLMGMTGGIESICEPPAEGEEGDTGAVEITGYSSGDRQPG